MNKKNMITAKSIAKLLNLENGIRFVRTDKKILLSNGHWMLDLNLLSLPIRSEIEKEVCKAASINTLNDIVMIEKSSYSCEIITKRETEESETKKLAWEQKSEQYVTHFGHYFGRLSNDIEHFDDDCRLSKEYNEKGNSFNVVLTLRGEKKKESSFGLGYYDLFINGYDMTIARKNDDGEQLNPHVLMISNIIVGILMPVRR